MYYHKNALLRLENMDGSFVDIKHQGAVDHYVLEEYRNKDWCHPSIWARKHL